MCIRDRSRDAVSFEQVKEVDAAGNSGNILAYNEKDESPILGTSYSVSYTHLTLPTSDLV